MDNNEFLTQIHSFVEDEYCLFKGFQAVSISILKEFDRICRNNQIKYFLAYGTLLGAVRDHCQVPWDYDIDVFVSVDDKELLLSILNSSLGDDFYYAYIDNIKHYPAPCLRVCKRGYSFMAIHVDIFFLIGCPIEEMKRNQLLKKVNKNIRLREEKNGYLYDENSTSKSLVRKVFHWLMRIKSLLYFDKLLNISDKKIMYKYKLCDCDYCIVFCNTYNKVYPISIFEETTKLDIDNYSFAIPSGYDEFLSITYGNYKKYPNIRIRFEEFYYMNQIIKKRQDDYKLVGK